MGRRLVCIIYGIPFLWCKVAISLCVRCSAASTWVLVPVCSNMNSVSSGFSIQRLNNCFRITRMHLINWWVVHKNLFWSYLSIQIWSAYRANYKSGTHKRIVQRVQTPHSLSNEHFLLTYYNSMCSLINENYGIKYFFLLLEYLLKPLILKSLYTYIDI